MRLDFETILGIIFFVVFFILPAFSRRKKQPEGEAPRPAAADAAPRSAGERPAGQEARGRPLTTQQASTRQAQPQAAPSTHRGDPQSRGRGTGGTFEDALDDIRARVREAQLQEDARRAPTGQRQPERQGQLVGNDSFEGRLTTAEASKIRGKESASSAPQSAARGAPPAAGRGTPPAAGRGASTAAGRPVAPAARPTPPRPPTVGRAPTVPGRQEIAEPLTVTRPTRRSGARSMVADDRRADEAQAGGVPRGPRAAARIGVPVLAMDRKALVTGMIWHEILAEPAAQRRLRRMRSRPR